MTLDEALDALRAHIEPGRAEGMAAYMKVDRPYLGVAMPAVNELTKAWRQQLDIPERIVLADALWKTNIHEAMIAATKLFIQARIRPDEEVWRLIVSWLPDFDAWAIADHAMMAGQKRVVADPARLDEVEGWTKSDHMWTRRAAMVVTLPFTKQNHPKPHELAARNRVLGWAAGYVDDQDWFIQKSVAWWVRELSKHDRAGAHAFLQEHGARLKPFARKEAAKYL